jgi:hypothetical protein
MLFALVWAMMLPCMAQSRWQIPFSWRLYPVSNDDLDPAISLTVGGHYRVLPKVWLGADAGVEVMLVGFTSDYYATLPVMATMEVYPFNGRLQHLGVYGNVGHHFYLGCTDIYDTGLKPDGSHGTMADVGLLWTKPLKNSRVSLQVRAGYGYRAFHFDELEPIHRRCLVLGFGLVL